MLPLNYEYIFAFENSTKMVSMQKIAAQVMTNNCTLSCNTRYHDGDAITINAKFGEIMRAYIRNSKRIRLQQDGNCRTRPYTEEFNDYLVHFAVDFPNQLALIILRHYIPARGKFTPNPFP